jgi:hypothetical protein
MSFDYSAAKAALKKAGHVVSTGPHVLASDIKELVSFGRRKFGLKGSLVRRGIGNPALLPEGFPGVTAAPVADASPEAAPVVEETPAVAPVAIVEPVAPAEDAKAKKKAADAPAPEVTAQAAPATETPATDAPAAAQ